jgi:OOP family OmpA-OmpF porin
MKSKQTFERPVLFFMTLLTVGPSAMAQDSGWYVGANAGQAKANIDEERVATDLLAVGLTTVDFWDDDTHFGYKLFTGYQFNRFFAIEGGLFDLGNFNLTAVTLPAGSLREEIKVTGLNMDLLVLLPFTEKLSMFGRAGGNYAESEVSFQGTDAVVVLDSERKERDKNYKFGFGLQYFFTDNFAMRAEAERYRIDDAVGNRGDIDLYSAGLLYRFGGPEPVAAPVEPPPVPPPPPPPPPAPLPPLDSDHDGVIDDRDKCPGTPAGVAVDADGCPRKGSITLEGVTFEYDSSILSATSRDTLDTLATDLVKYRRLRVELQGHTDNVGSDKYNLTLSHRRANAVRAYLLDHAVPADRLTAKGYGELQPIDDNGTEAGRARNRRVVMFVVDNPGEVKIEGEGTVEK